MTIRLKTTVGKDGTITVDHLPLAAGQPVELTIESVEQPSDPESRYPLQGTPYRYEAPFAPAVEPDEWEANR